MHALLTKALTRPSLNTFRDSQIISDRISHMMHQLIMLCRLDSQICCTSLEGALHGCLLSGLQAAANSEPPSRKRSFKTAHPQILLYIHEGPRSLRSNACKPPKKSIEAFAHEPRRQLECVRHDGGFDLAHPAKMLCNHDDA